MCLCLKHGYGLSKKKNVGLDELSLSEVGAQKIITYYRDALHNMAGF